MIHRQNTTGTMFSYSKTTLLCMFIVSGWTISACFSTDCAAATSPRGLVADGNKMYAAGNYQKALDAYGKASVDAPESPEISFNQGDAYFRQGDLVKSKSFYEKAALQTKDLAFEARCRYNIGNGEIRQAQRQRDSDPRKVVAGYEQGIKAYQDALRLKPSYSAAAHNLEVARILLKNFLDEQQKNPDSNEQRQKQNQELRKELEKIIKEQKQETYANKDLTRQKEKDKNKDLSPGIKQLSQDQSGTHAKTDQLSRKMDQALKNQPNDQKQGPSPMGKANEELGKASREQGSAVGKLDRQDLSGARPDQEKALDHLKKALDELGGDTGQSSSQTEQGPQKEEQKKQGQNQKPGQGAKNAAAKPEPRKGEEKPRDERAGDILQEERQNQDKQMRNVQGQHSAVDKDW